MIVKPVVLRDGFRGIERRHIRSDEERAHLEEGSDFLKAKVDGPGGQFHLLDGKEGGVAVYCCEWVDDAGEDFHTLHPRSGEVGRVRIRVKGGEGEVGRHRPGWIADDRGVGRVRVVICVEIIEVDLDAVAQIRGRCEQAVEAVEDVVFVTNFQAEVIARQIFRCGYVASDCAQICLWRVCPFQIDPEDGDCEWASEDAENRFGIAWGIGLNGFGRFGDASEET